MTGTVLNMPHGTLVRAAGDFTITVWIAQEPVVSKGWVADMLGPEVNFKLDIFEGTSKTPVILESVKDVETVLLWLRKSGHIRVWNNTNVKDCDFGLDADEIIEKI